MVNQRPSRVAAARTLLVAVVNVPRFFLSLVSSLSSRTRSTLSVGILLAAFGLSGCTNLWQAGIDSMSAVKPKRIDLTKETLNPNLEYLLVRINRQELLMVRGYQLGHQEVWFSSDGAILTTERGYLRSTEGFEVNWQAVQGPELATLATLRRPTAYQRTRNQQPGYRYGIRESVLVTPLATPPANAPPELASRKQVRWFSETIQTQFGDAQGDAGLKGSFALDLQSTSPVLIYGKQCLRDDYCIAWQRISSSSSSSRSGS